MYPGKVVAFLCALFTFAGFVAGQWFQEYSVRQREVAAYMDEVQVDSSGRILSIPDRPAPR